MEPFAWFCIFFLILFFIEMAWHMSRKNRLKKCCLFCFRSPVVRERYTPLEQPPFVDSPVVEIVVNGTGKDKEIYKHNLYF